MYNPRAKPINPNSLNNQGLFPKFLRPSLNICSFVSVSSLTQLISLIGDLIALQGVQFTPQ